MNLSEPFIRRPVMTIVVTVSAVLFGILSFTRLPVDALPSVDYPIIVVNAVYPGASPETMASTVATPLERQFMQINGLELVTSKSTQGHTALTLQFNLEKSLDAAATDVQTAISQATPFLPSDMPSPPTFSKNNPNDQPLMYIAITSDTVTKGKLYDYASTQLGQKLSILPGVSRVQIFGAKSAIRIKVDPSALAARRMTVDDVSEAIRRGTSSVGAGQLEGSSGSSLLRPLGQLDTVDGYRNLIVSSEESAPVYLSDVAEVVESLEDERINLKFWVRDREVPPATLVAAVTRRAGANAVEVAQSIRNELPLISATLPSSVIVTPIYDRSWSIVQSVADVEETLIIAFVLVVLVIFVFLGRATDTLIPAVAMPLSLLLTFIAMRFLGYSIDNLSLMALTLAIGFLVDDAIVFLENTVRRMEHGERALEASINGAKEISFTILSMTVSLAAVFIPLVFMSGQVGRVFREFAVTIIIAIVASGLVSLTLTPLMCARMLRDRGPGTKRTLMERVFGAVERRILAAYGATLTWFLRWKFISALIWAGCLVGTVWLFMTLPKTMLPAGDSSVVFGVFIAREGSSPEQMKRYQDQVLKVFESDPDVIRSITITGATGFLNSNMGMTFTFLKPPQERKPIQAKAGELMGRIAQIPGLVAGLQPWAVLEIQAGAVNQNQGQYSYAISGVDPGEVYQTAGKLMMRLLPLPGTPAEKLFDSMIPDLWANTPNLEVAIRREQARSQGVSEARILTLLQTAYAQNYVYLIKKPEDQYQVIVEVADHARSNPDDLGLLYIRSDDGQTLVPLSALVDWNRTVGLQAVNHINQFTSVNFSLNIKPGVALGDATKYVDQVAAEVVPPTLRKGFQGQAESFQATMSDLTILLYLAVFVMYVILAILYESYVHPLTVLSTLPPALVGGLASLYFFGEQASLYAFVGLFMLMGIVKKNGIMIVDFARHRVDAGEPADKAIHDASMDRFRPIIMTTLAAVMGAVPIALGYGADGASRRPLGLVIVGGLIVSQFITLFVTPVIYLYMESFQKKVLDRIPFFRSHPAPAKALEAARDESLEVSLSPEAKSHGR